MPLSSHIFFQNIRLGLLQEKKKADKKPAIKKDKDESKAETVNGDVEDGAATIAELMKTKVHFHLPGENHTTDG